MITIAGIPITIGNAIVIVIYY